MPQEAEARRVSPRVEKPGAGTPHRNPLPCMFSGICPCSPCDRASPGASVSTLGSMTRRQRAGMGCRCRSGSPAPGHGQHRFNSGRQREGVTSVPAHPPSRRSCQAGLRSPVRSRGFTAVPELSAGDPRYQATLRRACLAAGILLRKGGGSDGQGAAARDSDLCAPRSGGQQRRPPAATAAAAERLQDSFHSQHPPSGSRSAGVSLSLSLSPHFSPHLYCPLFSAPFPYLLQLSF